MPPTSERPLTPDERKDLEALARSGSATRQALQLASYVFAVLLVAGFLIVWIFKIPRAEGRIGFGVVAGLIAARVFTRTRRRFAEISDASAVKSDLAAGVASASAWDVADAVKVEELEDEGSSYYLKLADGRVLFASGQYLYDFEEQKKFPSTRIVFVRAPRSRTLLDLRCEGTYVAPRAVLPPFDKKRIEEGDIPCDGEIVRLSWNEILARAGAPPSSVDPDITSEGEEGFHDLMFALRSMNRRADRGWDLEAWGRFRGEPVGFAARIGPKWEERDAGSGGLTLRFGEVTLASVGPASDALVRAIDEIYGSGLAPGRMTPAVTAPAVALGGDPANPDREALKLKLFFESEDEERYGEIYLNVDAAAKKVYLSEKDEHYRKPVVRALTAG